MIRKLLIALDDLKGSEKILDYESTLTNIYSKSLFLINGMHNHNITIFTQPIFASLNINPKFTSRSQEVSKNYHRTTFSKYLNSFNKTNSSLNISAKLFDAITINLILGIGKDENIDSIIGADKYRNHIHKFFLASVRYSIFNNSELLVLLK